MPLTMIPENWHVSGELPSVNIERLDEDGLELLDEDLLQVSDPTNAFTLDVGWYPASQKSGQFVCRAIDGRDWDAPLEELRTRDISDVETWLDRWIKDICARGGEPAELVMVPTKPLKVKVVLLAMPPSLDPEDRPLTHGDETTTRRQLPSANVSSGSIIEYAT